MLFAISILTISILACGPAVGRAIGDAEVDVDATLANLEPETEAEQELYDMLKEIDRLHKEERAELLEALDSSSEVIDELIMLISDDVDLGNISVSAQNLTDGGPEDSDLSDPPPLRVPRLGEQAPRARDVERDRRRGWRIAVHSGRDEVPRGQLAEPQHLLDDFLRGVTP